MKRVYIHIFLFLLISSPSLGLGVSYRDFFVNNTIKQLMSTTKPKNIEPVKSLRKVYMQKKINYDQELPGSVNEVTPELLRADKDDAYYEYKSALDKYYELKEHLLGLTSLSDMKFLANVIRSGVTNINRDYVYCKLDKYFSEKSLSKTINNNYMDIEYTQIDDCVLCSRDVWVNTFYRHTDIYGDNNDTVNDKKRGVILGYDHSLYTRLYIKADEQNVIDEKDDSAKIKSMSLGMYGNLLVRSNIKWLVEIGFGKYETRRNLSPEQNILGEKASGIAKANFTCTTINADIEISKNTPLKSLILKPFAGLSMSSNFYPSFKEDSTTSLIMNVYGGVYWRSLARVGVGVQKDYKKWSISSKIFSEIVLTSLSPEITYTYDFSTIFKSKGTSEEFLKPGVSLYLDYKVCESFSVSGNIEVRRGGDFCLNGGVVYSFGKIVGAKEKKEYTKRIFVVTKEN
ncbi:MAG: autotransporter outer membrane beta-barrel domain-containing protein [Endomicrobium sp.]|nr:autotransporter outer membrane beta-barrel domain-containing protein [Endomicrobium sp.]